MFNNLTDYEQKEVIKILNKNEDKVKPTELKILEKQFSDIQILKQFKYSSTKKQCLKKLNYQFLRKTNQFEAQTYCYLAKGQFIIDDKIYEKGMEISLYDDIDNKQYIATKDCEFVYLTQFQYQELINFEQSESNIEIFDILCQTEFFSDINRETIRNICPFIKKQQIYKKQFIFQRNESYENCYIIINGEFSVDKRFYLEQKNKYKFNEKLRQLQEMKRSQVSDQIFKDISIDILSQQSLFGCEDLLFILMDERQKQDKLIYDDILDINYDIKRQFSVQCLSNYGEYLEIPFTVFIDTLCMDINMCKKMKKIFMIRQTNIYNRIQSIQNSIQKFTNFYYENDDFQQKKIQDYLKICDTPINNMIEPDLNETYLEEEIKQKDKQELWKLQMNQNDIKIEEYQEQQKANNNLNFQMINNKNFTISKTDENKNQIKQLYPYNQLKIQNDLANNQKNDQLQQYLLQKEEQLNTERTKRLKQGDMNQLMFQTHELQNINEFIQQATGGKKTTIARKMTEKYAKRGENTIDYRQELTRKIVRKNRKILKKQDQVEKQMKFKLDPNYKQNIQYGKSLKDVVNQQFQQQEKDQKQMMEEFAVQMKQKPLVAKAKVRKILDNFEIISNDNKKSIFSKQDSQKQKQKQEDRLKKYQQIYKQSEVFQDPQNKNKNLQIKRDQLMQNILINQAQINTQKQEEEEKLLQQNQKRQSLVQYYLYNQALSDIQTPQLNQTQQIQQQYFFHDKNINNSTEYQKIQKQKCFNNENDVNSQKNINFYNQYKQTQNFTKEKQNKVSALNIKCDNNYDHNINLTEQAQSTTTRSLSYIKYKQHHYQKTDNSANNIGQSGQFDKICLNNSGIQAKDTLRNLSETQRLLNEQEILNLQQIAFTGNIQNEKNQYSDTGRDHDTALNMIKEECLKEKLSDLNSQQSEEQINQTQQVQSDLKNLNDSKLSLNIEEYNNLFKNPKIQKPIKKISFQLQSPKSNEKQEYQMKKKKSFNTLFQNNSSKSQCETLFNNESSIRQNQQSYYQTQQKNNQFKKNVIISKQQITLNLSGSFDNSHMNSFQINKSVYKNQNQNISQNSNFQQQRQIKKINSAQFRKIKQSFVEKSQVQQSNNSSCSFLQVDKNKNFSSYFASTQPSSKNQSQGNFSFFPFSSKNKVKNGGSNSNLYVNILQKQKLQNYISKQKRIQSAISQNKPTNNNNQKIQNLNDDQANFNIQNSYQGQMDNKKRPVTAKIIKK